MRTHSYNESQDDAFHPNSLRTLHMNYLNRSVSNDIDTCRRCIKTVGGGHFEFRPKQGLKQGPICILSARNGLKRLFFHISGQISFSIFEFLKFNVEVAVFGLNTIPGVFR